MESSKKQWGFVSVAMVSLSCSAPPPESGRYDNAPTLEAQTALVKDLTVPAPRVRFRRHVTAVENIARQTAMDPPYDLRGTDAAAVWEAQKRTIADNTRDSGWEEGTPEGKTRLVLQDENDDEWELEFDTSALAQLHADAEARGLNRPSSGAAVTKTAILPPGVQPQGWSNGTDSRVAEPINGQHPVDDNVLARMGWLGSNLGECSATLVGRRVVLTAAHCVVDATGSVPVGTVFYAPRRDGATLPYGSPANVAKSFDSRYLDNNCNTNYTAATRETCGRYDWAILIVPSNAWDATGVYWAGYWVPAESGWFARNDGYPGCGNPASPAGCVARTAYGQDIGHSLFNFRGPVDGENTIFNSANDISPGHSGGMIRSSTYPDSNGPYVLGVVTNEMCGTCNEPGVSQNDKTYPAMSRKMTVSLAGTLDYMRTRWP